MPGALRYYLYTFSPTNPYRDDFSVTVSGINGRFRMPPDMTEEQADNFVTAMGAIKRTDTVPCSLGAGELEPRKIIFIRANGNSISFILPRTDNIITLATQGRDALNAVDADNPVVCIKLEGEHWLNIYDRFAPAGKVIQPGTPTTPPDTEGKQYVWSGFLTEYKSDVPWQQNIIMPFRMNSDKDDEPPTILTNLWEDCMGTIGNVFCSGKERRVSRRFILTLAILLPGQQAGTNEINNTQTLTIPSIHPTSQELTTCAGALASLPSTLCLEYYGESFDRVHQFVV